MEGEVGLGQWAVLRKDDDVDPSPEQRHFGPPEAAPAAAAEVGGGNGLEVRTRELRAELTEALRELELLRAEQRVQQPLVVLEGGLGRPEPADAGEGAETQPPAEAAGAAPPEGVLVPLDAWQRMLQQLGNLHEAGQQLAEARERAAKAETEAGFLRERVRDLRGELEQLRTDATQVPAPTAVPERSRRRRFWRRVPPAGGIATRDS